MGGPLVDFLGHRRSMQLGSLCYFVWVLAGILPVSLGDSKAAKTTVWIIMIIAGMINGFGASILWVGQGFYVTQCSGSENKGFFFGLFWCLLMISQVFGNLIAAFAIDLFSQTVMFSMMAVFAFLGFVSFLFLREPEKVNEDDKRNALRDEERESASPAGNGYELLNDTEVDGLQKSKRATLSSTFRLFLTSKMLRVSLIFVHSGVVLSFYAGLLVKLISNTVDGSDDDKVKKSLYCMILLGVGEI